MVMGLAELILIVFGLAYLFLWISQLVQLMTLSDKDFPGRIDKPLWVVIYIVFALVAPVIFIWWKKTYLHVRHLERNN